MKYCSECGAPYPERHHRIFKSQGGRDFQLNYIYLCHNCHRGNNGPHRNRETDLRYKKELQIKLQTLLTEDYYTLEQLIRLLEITKAQAKKTFKHLRQYKEGYARLEVIFRLLGDRFYV